MSFLQCGLPDSLTSPKSDATESSLETQAGKKGPVMQWSRLSGV